MAEDPRRPDISSLRNPRDLLTPEDREALHDDLVRMAKQRRQAEIDGRGKGLG